MHHRVLGASNAGSGGGVSGWGGTASGAATDTLMMNARASNASSVGFSSMGLALGAGDGASQQQQQHPSTLLSSLIHEFMEVEGGDYCAAALGAGGAAAASSSPMAAARMAPSSRGLLAKTTSSLGLQAQPPGSAAVSPSGQHHGATTRTCTQPIAAAQSPRYMAIAASGHGGNLPDGSATPTRSLVRAGSGSLSFSSRLPLSPTVVSAMLALQRRTSSFTQVPGSDGHGSVCAGDAAEGHPTSSPRLGRAASQGPGNWQQALLQTTIQVGGWVGVCRAGRGGGTPSVAARARAVAVACAHAGVQQCKYGRGVAIAGAG